MADGTVLDNNSAPAPAGGDGGAPAGGPSGGSAPSGGGAPSNPEPAGGGGGSAPAPAGAAATLAGGGEVTPPANVPATWPDDWRQKVAGDDKAFLKTLERFNDPSALAKSYREASAKLAQGVKPATPPADATPEQMAEWRKEAGLPENPDAYITGLELPNGMVFGEADTPVLKEFAETAHEANIPPAQFAALVQRYAAIQDKQAAAMREADAALKNETLIELTREWGGETKGNLNAINALFVDAPDGLADRLLTARMPDGKILGNSPEALKWLSGLAREVNPMSSLLPAGAQGDALKGGEARIKEIEGYMRAPDSQALYWKNAAVQEELRNLYEARDKLAARGR